MTTILPTNTPPENTPPENTREKGRTIVCECCASRLDRHGNLLKRGDLAKQMIDAEDKIAEVKKQLQKAHDDLAAANRTIDELKAAVPAKKSSIFDIDI